MFSKSRVLFIGLLLMLFTVPVSAATFSDNFDDSNFTNSHWQNGNSPVGNWTFVPIAGSSEDFGWHASINNTSSEEPAVQMADNSKEHYNAGLHLETLVRIGSHDDANNVENKAFVGFSATDEGLYLANLRLNYEGITPIIDLYLGIPRDGQEDQVLDETSVSIDFDTFYKLVVQVDSEQAMDVSLYDLNNSLLGNVSSPKVLTSDKGVVVIGGRYETTFNDFSVSSVPIPGAIWLLGSGLVGLMGLRKKFKK